MVAFIFCCITFALFDFFYKLYCFYNFKEKNIYFKKNHAMMADQ